MHTISSLVGSEGKEERKRGTLFITQKQAIIFCEGIIVFEVESVAL